MFLDLIARALLMPVLLGQALYVRFRVAKLAEPVGVRRGVVGDGPQLRLLILGDSSALGVGVLHQDLALLGHGAVGTTRAGIFRIGRKVRGKDRRCLGFAERLAPCAL